MKGFSPAWILRFDLRESSGDSKERAEREVQLGMTSRRNA
jgi:hypothetical protein